MMSVMISIKPKWCELIASGKKTVEVRKTCPKIEPPFKCYIYQTVGGRTNTVDILKNNLGKVIGEFACDRIDDITVISTPVMEYIQVNGKASMTINSDTCLDIDELSEYANGKTLYGWHISDLVIYDKPKEFSEFCVEDKNAVKGCKHRFRTGQPEDVARHGGWLKGSFCCNKDMMCMDWCTNCLTKSLNRPPQSWCYCEVSEND